MAFRTSTMEQMENPGQAVREPAVALFTIDTADRIKIDSSTGYRVDTTTPNKIYINKQTTLIQGYFTRLALTELNFQWNIPNIISTSGLYKNDTLTLDISGDGITVVELGITGFKTPNELAEDLEDALNVPPGTGGTEGWTVVYREETAGFRIQAPAGVQFRIIPKQPSQGRDLCTPMGLLFPPATYTNYILSSFAPMTYTPYFDIVSLELTKKQNVRDNSTSTFSGVNLLARIYLNEEAFVNRKDGTDPANGIADCFIVGTRPFTLYKAFETPKQIFWDTKEFISVIDLELRDAYGNILYSPEEAAGTTLGIEGRCGNNANYQLTVQVSET